MLTSPNGVESRQEVIPTERDAYRSEWLAARQENPEAGRTVLKEQFQRVYTWLQRHDQEWLAANQLPRQLPKPVPPRVDWEQRDGELAAAVREVGSGLRCSPEYLKQITVAAIARELGQLALIQQHLDRLPLTAKVFAGLVDPRSLDDVYLRLSEGQQLEHCQLIDAEQTFRGRDLYEALDHFEIRKQQ